MLTQSVLPTAYAPTTYAPTTYAPTTYAPYGVYPATYGSVPTYGVPNNVVV